MRWLLATALALGTAAAGGTDVPATTPVHLDVSVHDARGRVADKLTASDFKVTDAGGALPVISARFVGPSAPGSGRVLAVFLDEYHVDAASAARVRELLSTFVRDDLGAEDRMIVLKPLDSLLTLRLTSDRDALLSSIASFEGRLGDYEPRSPLEREVMAGSPDRADIVRAQVTVSALHALTTHLSQMPAGRKSLLLVSDGFPPRPLRRGGVILPTVDAVIRAANRSNVAIYPLKAGGAVADPQEPAAKLLQRFAVETDGRLTDLTTDAFRRLVTDMSGYYLLELSPAADGRFHAVDIQIDRPRLTVRTRPGFWTVSSEELARAKLAAEPLPPPPPMLPPVRASRLIRAWVGQSRGVGGLTRMTLVWEAAPMAAGERNIAMLPSRVTVKAIAPDATTLFQGVVSTARDGAAIGTRAVFFVPPGRVRLQLSVEDGAARQLDTDVRDILVTPFSAAVAFGTPAVYRARTARAFNELLDDPAAAPAPGRDFSRDERLLIRLPVYGNDDTTVTAALTNRTGQTMRSLAVSRVGDTFDRTIDLPLNSLAVGEYTVVISARETAHESKEAVQFRVTP